MSAWIVSKAHIDALVTAAVHAGVCEDPHAYGQVLVDENVASVQCRYPDDDVDELPGPIAAYWLHDYRHEPTRLLDRAELAGACSCFDYQTCERHEYADSDACRLIEQLRPKDVARGREAAWHLEAHDVRPVPVA